MAATPRGADGVSLVARWAEVLANYEQRAERGISGCKRHSQSQAMWRWAARGWQRRTRHRCSDGKDGGLAANSSELQPEEQGATDKPCVQSVALTQQQKLQETSEGTAARGSTEFQLTRLFVQSTSGATPYILKKHSLELEILTFAWGHCGRSPNTGDKKQLQLQAQ